MRFYCGVFIFPPGTINSRFVFGPSHAMALLSDRPWNVQTSQLAGLQWLQFWKMIHPNKNVLPEVFPSIPFPCSMLSHSTGTKKTFLSPFIETHLVLTRMVWKWFPFVHRLVFCAFTLFWTWHKAQSKVFFVVLFVMSAKDVLQNFRHNKNQALDCTRHFSSAREAQHDFLKSVFLNFWTDVIWSNRFEDCMAWSRD